MCVCMLGNHVCCSILKAYGQQHESLVSGRVCLCNIFDSLQERTAAAAAAAQTATRMCMNTRGRLFRVSYTNYSTTYNGDCAVNKPEPKHTPMHRRRRWWCGGSQQAAANETAATKLHAPMYPTRSSPCDDGEGDDDDYGDYDADDDALIIPFLTTRTPLKTRTRSGRNALTDTIFRRTGANRKTIFLVFRILLSEHL